MRTFLFLVITLVISVSCGQKKAAFLTGDLKVGAPANEDTQDPLESLLTHLRLTAHDLSIEGSSGHDFFRLKKVTHLLQNPLHIEPYSAFLSQRIEQSVISTEHLLSTALEQMEFDCQTPENGTSLSEAQSANLLSHIPQHSREHLLTFLSAAQSSQAILSQAFDSLPPSDLELLERYFSGMMLNDKIPLPEHSENSAAPASRLDEQLLKERCFYLAAKINRTHLYRASLLLAQATDRLLQDTSPFTTIPVNQSREIREGLSGDVVLSCDTPLGTIVIGGKGPTYYKNTPAFLIIDLGGNDEYYNTPLRPHGEFFMPSLSVTVDLAGNDLYRSDTTYSQGCGAFGLNFLIDRSGNDSYLAQDFSQGCGFFGVGLLYDYEGNDRYLADIMGQGSAAFGLGILCDLMGNDSYHGGLYNQGFGFVGGMGCLIESQGNDTFFSGGSYPDFREPSVAFDSFSQGFGLGYRNFASGGIGVLWDAQGNDHYSSSYFAQGSSYWCSIGMLIDNAGSDNYHARRYAQGTGTHLTVGALVDRSGNDSYHASLGVSQGCGHDLSHGLLFDEKGDDTYSAKWFAQGAGGSSGVGMLMDCTGDDSYICGPFNSQGSGQFDSKRNGGSIGLLIDVHGKDFYTGKGEDNLLWQQGKHGGGIDLPQSPFKPTTFIWSEHTVPLDSSPTPPI